MASADGYFYMFDVNTQEGGICKLLTQASLYTTNSTLFTNNTIGKELLVNNSGNSATANQNPFLNNNVLNPAGIQQQQQQQQAGGIDPSNLNNQQQQHHFTQNALINNNFNAHHQFSHHHHNHQQQENEDSLS